jgi:hypothetical protein
VLEQGGAVNYDFTNIQGSKQSDRENFEQLVCQLLAEEINAISVDGRGGDGGIDCFTRRSSNGIEVFQAKYFIGPLTRPQRRQIQRSLATALQEQKVARWVLCIPRDHTPAELRWFESLASPTLVVEWWGETKLRNLLARQPQIARQFFLGDRLSEEFALFRADFTKLLSAIASDHKRAPTSLSGNMADPIAYLDRAKEIGAILLDDITLFSSSQTPLISIDAFDISVFIEMDSRFSATAPPLVDYCLNESPVPLMILPPSCLELEKVVRYFMSVSQRGSLRQAQAPTNPKLLEEFLSAFEADPNSHTTTQAYRRIADEYRLDTFLAPGALLKLQGLLAKKRILLSHGGGAAEFKPKPEYVREALVAMEAETPMRRHRSARYVDGMNLAFLLENWSEANDPVRMISSARSFARAAKRLFRSRGPVRSSHQYSYLLSSTSLARGNQSDDDILGLLRSIDMLRKTILTHGEQPWEELRGLPQLVSAFEDFVPNYRRYLRPVDTLIVSSIRLSPEAMSLGMRDFYEFLSKEAELVKAFEHWWDHVTEILRAFTKQIPRYDEMRRLLKALEGS